MSGFAWLNELMTWLAKWVPRLVLVTSRHRALVFRPRDVVTEHGPGLLIYWPMIHQLQLVSMQLRTMLISAKLLGSEVVGVTMTWRIRFAKEALLSLNDVGAMVTNQLSASLSESHHAAITSTDLSSRTYDLVSSRLLPHGIEVVSVQVTERGWVLPLKTLADWEPKHEATTLDGKLE